VDFETKDNGTAIFMLLAPPENERNSFIEKVGFRMARTGRTRKLEHLHTHGPRFGVRAVEERQIRFVFKYEYMCQ
jgi:hypothetical protein